MTTLEAPQRSSRARLRARATAAVVGTVYLALAALLLSDLFDPRNNGYQVVPIRTHRLVDVSESIARARGVNPIIAVASSEAVGPEARLKLPVEHKELLARPADTFTGRTTATLNLGLIDPFLGGRVRVEDYDAVLTSAEVKALRADPRLVGLPMDVWALRAVGRGPVVRLYTDTVRMGIFIVPDGELPGEGR